MKYIKYSGIFLLLLMMLGISSAAAAPGVAEGESYTWDIEYSITMSETSTTASGTITATITKVSGSVVYYDLEAKLDSTISGLPSTGSETEDTSLYTTIEEAITASAIFVDTSLAGKSYTTSLSTEVMGTSYVSEISGSYNSKGVLEYYEMNSQVGGNEIHMKFTLQSGGVPGYPTLALAASTLLGIVVIALKKRH